MRETVALLLRTGGFFAPCRMVKEYGNQDHTKQTITSKASGLRWIADSRRKGTPGALRIAGDAGVQAETESRASLAIRQSALVQQEVQGSRAERRLR